MTVRTNGPAPYAPPATVLDLIQISRARGLQTPFDSQVLVRAGVSDSLVPRTLQAMRLLDLIDATGNPTPQFEVLRRAGTEEYPKRLEEVVRAAYAEVFQFVDPQTDSMERVIDAFRHYEPLGQLRRMVTLFMGLCEAAGIVPEGSARKSAPSGVRPRPVKTNTIRKVDAPVYRPSSVGAKARVRNDHDGLIPAAITGLFASLPSEGEGWTQARRESFLTVFKSVLDFVYPITEKSADSAPAE